MCVCVCARVRVHVCVCVCAMMHTYIILIQCTVSVAEHSTEFAVSTAVIVSLSVCVSVSTAYQHLTRTIEVSRVHLFDILTQYRAIFPDDDSAYHTAVATPTHIDGALFYTWLGSKVRFIT